ncbi:MAG: DUF1385 domain-containing protein [Bacillota bacterium]|nr:DUF1385 domain-containing protein [Bacillota bacterium]
MKNKPKFRCNIGGQAVLEGVMMKTPESIALAVRHSDGSITIKNEKFVPYAKRNKFLGLPVVRGVAAFVESLVVGTKTITDSAKILEEEERRIAAKKAEEAAGLGAAENTDALKESARPRSKTKEGLSIAIAVTISLIIFIALFIWLPNFMTNLIKPLIVRDPAVLTAGESIILNLIEGFLRILVFVGYLLTVTLMKDIRRVFMYHGAEHKVIHCFENGEVLMVENARKYKTSHPRCGTSYLFLVMVVAILLFSLLGWSGDILTRVGLRLLMLPVVAGLAYEVLRLAAKSDAWPLRVIRAPGVLLQKLSTREPDDSMIEVAIAAFNAAAENTSSIADEIKPKGNKDGH